MSTAVADPATKRRNILTSAQLPTTTIPLLLVAAYAASFGLLALFDAASWLSGLALGSLVFLAAGFALSAAVEGIRKAKDRLFRYVVTGAFLLALFPLVSVIWGTLSKGLARLDGLFFSSSMRNVVGEGGGAIHAIVGTLLITGMAAIISIPIGILTAIYLVEYGRGPFAKAITFFVDVMTGIPSIVAGLFAYALFSLIFQDPGIRFGFGGSVALSLLMIPVVVRSSEEMLKIVPNELREAAYALGVPKWLTIVKVVLPTSIAGIVTGIMLSIARVIGETAPLLIIAGFTASMNYDLFANRMMTLPVFVYTQYANPGSDVQVYLDRAWTGALVLILIVMALNLLGRLIAKIFAPKLGR